MDTSQAPDATRAPGAPGASEESDTEAAGPADGADGAQRALQAEQSYVAFLYERLDEARATAESALAEALGRGGADGYGALMDREATAAEQGAALQRLQAVEEGLCFGRIDAAGMAGPADTLYIGRLGLRDTGHEVVLVDWRAPAARPFYAATPQAPHGLARRRHLHTRGRTVTGLDDEVFDLDRLSDADRSELSGEAALLAALRSGRTGRMHDIVATIQGEQDRVIRSELQGVLVVQGGPGTGKTVAALHRAAYLLYTHRAVLERRGVLVVGPNPTFLRYIGQVLPSLGETDVVMSTVGGLYPGVRAEQHDRPAAAAAKGSPRMAELLRGAVLDRQRAPEGGLQVPVHDMVLEVGAQDCRALRDRARDLGVKHNAARTFFANALLRALAQNQQDQLEASMREAEEAAGLDALTAAVPELEDPDAPLWSEDDLESARETLWGDGTVRAAIDALWPPLTPEELVADLLSDAGALAGAARAAAADDPAAALPDTAERDVLLRPAGAPWTVDDVPLLDEAAELLGDDGSAQRQRDRAEEERRREAEHYAKGVLQVSGLWEDAMMTEADLAERHSTAGPQGTTAERAAADRSWAYGHVIVDEAQELSAMAWRTVMRRIPTRSLTVVGDVAQTGSAAGATSWSDALGTYAHGRLHVEHLRVNYRTPAEIMAVAADVLAAVAPDQEPPESVRDGGAPPRALRVAPEDWAGRLPELVAGELAAIGADGGAGRVAVIVPDARHAEFAALLPDAAADASPAVLDSPVSVLTCTLSKGLEFDAVVIADPQAILDQSPQGGRDLYVAITRATQRMTVLHEDGLPGVLSRLRD